MYGCDMMIGVSLSKPHIDHDNAPRVQNNGMSVSMYHLPCVCHTLAPEICVCLENACLRVWFTTALNQRRYDTRISPYHTSIAIAICTNCNWGTVRYACRTSSGTEHWPAWTMKTLSHEYYRWRQVGKCADTWYKWIQPTETVYDSGAVAAWQLANMPVWLDRWAARLYCYFVTLFIMGSR